MRFFKLSLLFASLLVLAIYPCQGQDQQKSISDNGAWCWFSDPRALYHKGEKEQIFSGWVRNDGSIEVGSYDLQTGQVSAQVIYPKLEYDDHNNPAFVVRPDGRVLAFYTKHGKEDIYLSISKNPEDITTWEEAKTINPVADPTQNLKHGYTYANPFILSEENNRIFLFGRWAGYKPNLSWSDDGGETWAKARVVINPQPFNPGQRPYVKYFSNGKDKIHMVFTDGHPNVEPTNSVYYAYYQHGAFYRADGSKICTIDELPFEPKDASLAYDATQTHARAWVHDICENKDGMPVIAYTRFPQPDDHRYHYAWFDGESWQDHEICKAGKWFPQTPEGEKETEEFYSAGISIDPNHPSTVFLSRPVEEVFEIEQWNTTDGGKTWTSSAITRHSEYDQVRPFVVWNMPAQKGAALFWMENEKYIHFTNYDSNIKAAFGIGAIKEASGHERR